MIKVLKMRMLNALLDRNGMLTIWISIKRRCSKSLCSMILNITKQ